MYQPNDIIVRHNPSITSRAQHLQRKVQQTGSNWSKNGECKHTQLQVVL
jgi:hypothetical protein